jgi:hypothetical protein
MSAAISASWPQATHGVRSRSPVTVHLTPRLILGIAVVVIVLAVAYRVSLWLLPYVTCRRCDGTGKVRGFFFSWGRDFCPKCGGDGIVPRLGTCLLGASNRSRPPRRTTW